jgi:hypothetical protein
MTKLAGLAVCCTALGALPAAAETLTARCMGEEFGKRYEMTMVYEGDDSGTMTISGAFGDMKLPAAKKQREGVNADGNTVMATEIWASDEIPVTAPDKAAIESCIRTKLPPDQVTDSDIVFMTIPSCAASAPPSAQPVPMKVYAEIGILDPETVFVTFKRTYLEQSDLPDGKIVLEPLPPPNCAIAQ